jgi:hypothetical protein
LKKNGKISVVKIFQTTALAVDAKESLTSGIIDEHSTYHYFKWCKTKVGVIQNG